MKRRRTEIGEESLSDQMEVDGDSTLHICDQCPRTFSSFNGLQIHRGKSHKINSQVHQQHQQHQQNQRFLQQQRHRNGGGTQEFVRDEDEPEIGEVMMPGEILLQEPSLPQAEDELDLTEAQNRIKWGSCVGLEAIKDMIDVVHSKITTWQKNFFKLPTNAVGKEVLKEAIHLIGLFNTKSVWEPIAIPLRIIFFPLLLQKPSARSKSADHTRFLKKRLVQWKEGRLTEIVSEVEEIQKRLVSSKTKKGGK